MKKYPPKWADRILSWYCNPDLLEDLQGDLYEIFDAKCNEGKVRKAQWLYWWYVIRSVRYSVIKRKTQYKTPTSMTGNHIKIAFRIFKKNPFYAGVSLVGLTIGIACFLLTGTFVFQELNYDQFHSKKDNIYRTWLKEDYGNNKVFFNAVTPPLFENLLEDNFSEIETAVKVDQFNAFVGEGDEVFDESITMISPEFFEVFDFNIIEGSINNPLSNKDEIILSEKYAKKYYGDRSAIGQILPVMVGEETRSFKVSAIMEDFQPSSSIQFNIAIGTQNETDFYGDSFMDQWFSVSPETYVLLKDGEQLASIEAKMQEVVMSYLKGRVEQGQYNIGFQPLTDIHLNPTIPVGINPIGNPSYVYILLAISILVLLVACINYSTLAIGQSMKRNKEVGIRKIMGGLKSSIIQQFIIESLLMAFISSLLGVLLAYVALPFFNSVTNANVVINFSLWYAGFILCLIIFIGLLSGIYPALILSMLNVNTIIKGNSRPKGNHLIRKSLVIFQFIVTVFLISATLIMSRQLDFLHTKDTGVDANATVSVQLYADPGARRYAEIINSGMNKGELLKQKIAQHPNIKDIAMGSHIFGAAGWTQLAYTDEEDNFRRFRMLTVDPAYLSTFDIKIVEGKSFDPKSELDQKQSILINQVAVNFFGLTDPIGKSLPGQQFGEHQIIGITDNFNYASLHNEVEPLIITQNPQPILKGISDFGVRDNPTPKLIFRYNGNDLHEVQDLLEESWTSLFPGEELNFNFIEREIRYQYQAEDQMKRLVSFSTILSITIAGIGLLGLIVLVANSKTKEIGIRKVNGASTLNIFSWLIRNFSFQILIAVILSIPLTVWIMNDWLNNFANRITINPGIFILSTCLTLVLVLLVTSYHAYEAASRNPVDALKIE